MTPMPFPITIVNACGRDGRGGSPTAVVDETTASAFGARLTDAARSRIPRRCGTSHAVFIDGRRAAGLDGTPHADIRFFTAEGELPGCGHGTVAALAVLAAQQESTRRRYTLHASGRTFSGLAVRGDGDIHAAFDPGPITLRHPDGTESGSVLDALALRADKLPPGTRVASLGRARILIPLATPAEVAALRPDFARLRAACDRVGLLGCYVYSAPSGTDRLTARMFAPSIGVPEDIANANSTACLAAYLAGQGVTALTVDMGDSLGSPATITASVRRGPHGQEVWVGGAAILTGPGLCF